METTFIFPSDNTRFKENGSENTLSNDLELTPFKDFLLRKGASDNTIRIYLLAVRHFFSHSDTIDPENLQAHKAWLFRTLPSCYCKCTYPWHEPIFTIYGNFIL